MDPILKNFGLVLTGGGARGAYQAGVLKGLAHVLKENIESSPFQVLSGSSAGAINCAFLACHQTNFLTSCNELSDMWENIGFSDIYKTDTASLSRLGFSWAKGLSFAGMGSSAAPNHLLDTGPLRKLIDGKIDLRNLNVFHEQGRVLAINTTNYKTGATVTFFSGDHTSPGWFRNLRLSKPTKISTDHIMASSAIPLLFPPVKIEKSFYGDGALRMKSPFSPAIHLGANKIFAIGVRKPRSEEDINRGLNENMENIYLSDIAGVILNSVFLDSLDSDLERLQRINTTLANFVDSKPDSSPLKPIDVLVVQPSQDLGEMARPTLNHFPKALRYLLKGIGADDKRGSDLLSYLSFHPSYTHKLINLGFEDALERQKDILDFFNKP